MAIARNSIKCSMKKSSEILLKHTVSIKSFKCFEDAKNVLIFNIDPKISFKKSEMLLSSHS